MVLDQEVRALYERRQNLWDNAKAFLERINNIEQRELSADENAQFHRMIDEINSLDRQRNELLSSSAAHREIDEINEAARRVSTPAELDARNTEDNRMLREFLTRGSKVREINIDLRPARYVHHRYLEGARGADLFERRGIFGDTGNSGGSLTIPSLVSSEVFQVFQQANVMRQTRATVITTDHGDPIAVPVFTQGLGTQIANQNTAVLGSDPSIASKTLRAYAEGNLVAISNDMIADSGVNVLEYVANNIALAVALQEEPWLVAGTGSNQPTGIMKSSAVGSAGTIATGGSLIIGPAGREVEKLIDVSYGVNNYYRSSAEWMMHPNTAATVRKLRDGAGGTSGSFLWRQPSLSPGAQGGEPDLLLGFPVWSSTNVGSMASDASICVFGDFSRYAIREAGGFMLDRSDDLYFDKSQVALRGRTRVDGALTDTTALTYLHQSVT